MPRPRVRHPRRIVFLTLAFHPDTSATSILFTDLFARMAKTGIPITVLCGFPTKDSEREVQELPRSERYRGITIVRCGLRLRGKASMFARVLAYTSFLLHAGLLLLRVGRGAVVVGGTDPPFTPIALWFWSVVGRFRYQCLLLDIYPDGLVALGSLSPRSPITRLWRALNRRAYRAAVRVIVIGRDMADLLAERYGLSRDRIAYVPHWASEEMDHLPPAGPSALLAELGLSEKFVVQYSGNMGLWHDLETVVRAADLLRDRSHIHFLLIGKGMRRAGAERLGRELALTNIAWLDFVPRTRLPATLQACNAAIVSFRSGLAGTAVPSKLYGILAAGRAVIAQVPDRSEVALTVRGCGCGGVVPPGDARALADAIVGLACDPGGTIVLGERARAAYSARYTIDHAAVRFARLWASDGLSCPTADRGTGEPTS